VRVETGKDLAAWCAGELRGEYLLPTISHLYLAAASLKVKGLPALPSEPQTTLAVIHALDALAECLKKLSDTADTTQGKRIDEPTSSEAATVSPDGPEPPNWLRWKGKRHRIGSLRSKRSWSLLCFFWNRDSATFQELVGPGKPWPDPVSESAKISAVNRFNNDLPSGFPWRLRTANFCVEKESQENPAK